LIIICFAVLFYSFSLSRYFIFVLFIAIIYFVLSLFEILYMVLFLSITSPSAYEYILENSKGTFLPLGIPLLWRG
jgi:hypothetical protein